MSGPRNTASSPSHQAQSNPQPGPGPQRQPGLAPLGPLLDSADEVPKESGNKWERVKAQMETDIAKILRQAQEYRKFRTERFDKYQAYLKTPPGVHDAPRELLIDIARDEHLLHIKWTECQLTALAMLRNMKDLADDMNDLDMLRNKLLKRCAELGEQKTEILQSHQALADESREIQHRYEALSAKYPCGCQGSS